MSTRSTRLGLFVFVLAALAWPSQLSAGPAAAALSVSPKSISVQATVGQNAASQTVQVAKGAGKSVKWSIVAPVASWLKVSPASGTTPPLTLDVRNVHDGGRYIFDVIQCEDRNADPTGRRVGDHDRPAAGAGSDAGSDACPDARSDTGSDARSHCRNRDLRQHERARHQPRHTDQSGANDSACGAVGRAFELQRPGRPDLGCGRNLPRVCRPRRAGNGCGADNPRRGKYDHPDRGGPLVDGVDDAGGRGHRACVAVQVGDESDSRWVGRLLDLRRLRASP